MLIEEAKQKWCPIVRVPQQQTFYDYVSGTSTQHSTVVVGNRHMGGSLGVEHYCIADRCMLWRTVLGDETRGYCGHGGFGGA